MSNRSAWEESTNQILEHYKQYSANDIAEALFISSVWLPNIASPIQHQFMVAVYACMSVTEFSSEDRIDSYESFSLFLERLFQFAPRFPVLEDYVPEPDWGEVKYFFEGESYQIFYGTDLSNIYDFLSMFELFYVPLDDAFMDVTQRSPRTEFKHCLDLQNLVIANISTQPADDNQKTSISPGHKELPPVNFWADARSLFRHLSAGYWGPTEFAATFSIELGTLKTDDLEYSAFVSNVFEGTLLEAYYIKAGDYLFPILPRNFSSVLFNKWAQIFSNYAEQVQVPASDYQKYLSLELSGFLSQRFRPDDFKPLVSAVKPDNQLDDLVFAGLFLTADRMALCYITSPFTSAEEITDELQQLNPRLQEATQLIKSAPTTLGLLLEKKHLIRNETEHSRQLGVEVIVVLAGLSTGITQVRIPESLLAVVTTLDQFLGVLDEIDDPDELLAFLDYLQDEQNAVTSPLATWLDNFGAFRDSHGILVAGANEPNLIMLDPHWGSNFRYESLSTFWSLFPSVNVLGHPRNWEMQSESPAIKRLMAKSRMDIVLCTVVGATSVLITAPFAEATFEQNQLLDLMTQILADYLTSYSELLEKHPFFDRYGGLQVTFVANGLLEKEALASYRGLNPENSMWSTDFGILQSGIPGIRLVFDEAATVEALRQATNNTFEISLLIEILRLINCLVPSPNIEGAFQIIGCVAQA